MLGLTLTDCGTLPLHLHRSAVEITNFPHKKAREFVINAPLPEYFSQTLQNLDLMVEADRMISSQKDFH